MTGRDNGQTQPPPEKAPPEAPPPPPVPPEIDLPPKEPQEIPSRQDKLSAT